MLIPPSYALFLPYKDYPVSNKVEPKKTPLYAAHVAANGKMVDFSGWNLPINYGSQIKEHEAVRTNAGMFDVSHMVVTDVTGKDTKAWLQKLLANDVAKLKQVGKALYSAMLNEKGGVIDDLIVYLSNESETAYRIVSNAATRDKDLAHFEKTAASFDIQITERPELAMLAVQGPKAIEKLLNVKPNWKETLDNLKFFVGADLTDIEAADWFVARTGYTGEDGVEVILPEAAATQFFKDLQAAGVTPAGLGARDTLRMEAGMNLYGHDMDENISPLDTGMGWTLAMKDDPENKRDFIGRKALEAQKAAGVTIKQVGLLLESRGVLREGMAVQTDAGEGVITSGTFSPSLKQSIAIARIPKDATEAKADLRGTLTSLRILKLPFVRNGKKQFDV